MFKTCFCKKRKSPVYYEIPDTRYKPKYESPKNISPPPVPPRRCRKWKTSIGSLIPMATEKIFIATQNICIGPQTNNSNIIIYANGIYNSNSHVNPSDYMSTYTVDVKSFAQCDATSNTSSCVSGTANVDTLIEDSICIYGNKKIDIPKCEIEPLFTVEMKIKNERTGLVCERKMFM